MVAFRQLLEALLNPFFLCILLFGIVFIVLCLKGYSHSLRLLLGLILVILLALSTGWLPRYLTHRLENQYPIIEEVNPDIHWIVVLSGGQASVQNIPANMLLYNSSIRRLVEGVRLFRQLPKAQLLLSGGSHDENRSEAFHLSQLARWFAIPEHRLQQEPFSLNTADQAREIKKIVGEQPFYLVTAASHMPRAMALCRKQGLHPIAAPTDHTFYWNDERWQKTWIPDAHNIVYFNIALHELLGMLWGKLTGQI
ncbi:YdcF family protein [Legionella israelensis]|uniref:Membrane protein n=1 Tax=Legionella israelensis TaxID=454 RepID=A0A0W0WN67_9GAMM|nr:ElyC/SanA/YdcF family protein [Legionella israelensis]KTD33774.1 membrane protein [Legionella israelensis]QBS09267.1 YdcF family protein [Legionella israelensis]QDP71881.1 YdcF family protein [Legionella israelensis]SCY31761.1 Uncharacterized SAM-binding protein YcdF, DUF218 family [Legionella israelensis DSM 19235]STX59015.1 membrane protein [Legionella israelensis]